MGRRIYSGGLGGLLSLLDCSWGSLAALSSSSEKEVSVLDPVPSEKGSVDLVVVGSQDFPVDPPLLHAWQESQPEIPRSQAQALRVPTASLTSGPRVSGIQALPPETAGGLSLMPAVLDLGGFGDAGLDPGLMTESGDASGFLVLVRGPVRPMPGQATHRRSRVVGRGPP